MRAEVNVPHACRFCTGGTPARRFASEYKEDHLAAHPGGMEGWKGRFHLGTVVESSWLHRVHN